jgi:hypothetical protein
MLQMRGTRPQPRLSLLSDGWLLYPLKRRWRNDEALAAFGLKTGLP